MLKNKIDPEFTSVVNDYVAAVPDSKKELATSFEVSEATVLQWVLGFTSPEPLRCQQIISFIQSKKAGIDAEYTRAMADSIECWLFNWCSTCGEPTCADWCWYLSTL